MNDGTDWLGRPKPADETVGTELQEFVRSRIEGLRPKLLDFSRRNPLISTRFSPRSASHIRVVDELPDVLWYSLENGNPMRFISLPPLDDDPRDERTTVFQDALAEARLTDETYLTAVDAINTDSDTALEQHRQMERALKDQLRELLAMPARQTKSDVSLPQHARNNHISPSYELPQPDTPNPDGRHADDTIQTLLLPDDMDRKLSSLHSKCRTWIQETGINVLHAAFGFLDWTDSNGNESSLAPLVLVKVAIEKQRTHAGPEFWVRGTGDRAETNIVLAEKLRQDFGIDIPAYTGGSIEEYLVKVTRVSPKSLKWQLRRQVAFGVFPSARMAMYHDLDTSQNRFGQSTVVGKLLGGIPSQSPSLYPEEYDVDEPALEKKVPVLVMDADSSQFSALIDIADGRDLAIEGPPGTGKSQTIVNAIATAIALGKKVLFVAEKTAALDVVKSRLEAIGLGEFILALQADRSARENVIASIRARVAMSVPAPAADYARKVEIFRQTRAELAEYMAILSTSFGNTGCTIHDIIGRGIAANEVLLKQPKVIATHAIPDIDSYDEMHIRTLWRIANAVEESWRATISAPPYWQGHALVNIDRLVVEQTCDLAEAASDAYFAAVQARQALAAFNVNPETPLANLRLLKAVLTALPPTKSLDVGLIGKLCRHRQIGVANHYLEACERFQTAQLNLSTVLLDPADADLPNRLRQIRTLCKDVGIRTLNTVTLRSRLDEETDLLVRLNNTHDTLAQFADLAAEGGSFMIPEIIRARELVQQTSREILTLRDEVTADPVATAVLSRLVRRGRHLRRQRDEFHNAIFSTTTLPTADLVVHGEILRSAGRFRLLSSKYRLAKRFYLSISRRAAFDRSQAVDDIAALVEWKETERRFCTDPQASTVFGLHFQGIDTDFEAFDRLCRFYDVVDEQFSGIEGRDQKWFLKTAHLDLLMSIPEIDDTPSHKTVDQLGTDIAQRTLLARNLRQTLDHLESLIKDFKNPGTVNVESLDDLARQASDHSQLKASLDRNQEMKDLCGNRFHGAATDCKSLRTDIQAAQAIASIRSPAANSALEILERGEVQSAINALESAVHADGSADSVLAQLCQHTGMNPSRFSSERTQTGIAKYLKDASEDKQGLYLHSVYAAARQELADAGFDWLASVLLAEDYPLDNLGAILEAVVHRALTNEIFGIHGKDLRRFHGKRLDDLRMELATLDREIIRMARSHLRAIAHESATPPHGESVGPKSTWTEMSLLANEISKKQRYVPVRDLTTRSGRALLELKPCWMMSPLAIAQYLPRSEQKFDLCIIDEASQMPPENSIGALARSHQAVVVGDTNQLPPTSFFRKMIDDEDTEDETVLDESILEMANSAFKPKRRLRWHYRSRHSGLIKFSNHMIYNDDLVVFPSATESRRNMGVQLVSVRGRYHSGTNGEEARTMIDAALRFMRESPDRSLGLVTLNQKQRDLLLEEMDYSLSRDTLASKYVDDWAKRNDGLESFFIKNLENVQGDERDVIFIGTVYGPEEPSGPVMQRFGPINGLGGQRRLNVLFSRAKQQIVTFSSMTAADIRADESGNPGAYMLKRWLEYSATGFLQGGNTSSRKPDSDFEVFVIEQLRSMGFEPVPQVGVAGYFVDIGVKHPDWPHGFLMGVECDGASYHSSKSARDRDRLRQEVLEGLGWHLYRIWSTDWFNDSRTEARKLQQAITARLDWLKNNDDSYIASERGKPFTAEGEEIPFPDMTDPTHEPPDSEPQGGNEKSDPRYVDVGDTVHVRFLSGAGPALEVTLSDKVNDPNRGVIHIDMPLGHALVGAEEGDEIEILVGNLVREAVIDRVIKLGSAGIDVSP